MIEEFIGLVREMGLVACITIGVMEIGSRESFSQAPLLYKNFAPVYYYSRESVDEKAWKRNRSGILECLYTSKQPSPGQFSAFYRPVVSTRSPIRLFFKGIDLIHGMDPDIRHRSGNWCY